MKKITNIILGFMMVLLSSCYSKTQEIKPTIRGYEGLLGKYTLHTLVWHNSNIIWSEYHYSSNVRELDSLAPIVSETADSVIAILKRND